MRGLLLIVVCSILVSSCVVNVKQYQPPRRTAQAATEPTIESIQQEQRGRILLPPFYISQPVGKEGRIRHILWPLISIGSAPDMKLLALLPIFRYSYQEVEGTAATRGFYLYPFFLHEGFKPLQGPAVPSVKYQGVFPLYMRSSHGEGRVVTHTVALFQYGRNPRFKWFKIIPFPSFKFGHVEQPAAN